MIEKRGGAFEYEDNYKNCKKRKEKKNFILFIHQYLGNFFEISFLS